MSEVTSLLESLLHHIFSFFKDYPFSNDVMAYPFQARDILSTFLYIHCVSGLVPGISLGRGFFWRKEKGGANRVYHALLCFSFFNEGKDMSRRNDGKLTLSCLTFSYFFFPHSSFGGREGESFILLLLVAML